MTYRTRTHFFTSHRLLLASGPGSLCTTINPLIQRGSFKHNLINVGLLDTSLFPFLKPHFLRTNQLLINSTPILSRIRIRNLHLKRLACNNRSLGRYHNRHRPCRLISRVLPAVHPCLDDGNLALLQRRPGPIIEVKH